MASIKFERYQLVDIEIGASFSGNSITLPDQPMLRNMRITGIEAYSIVDFPISFITGNALPTTAQMALIALDLYTHDPNNEHDMGEFVYKLPLVTIHNMQTTQYVQRVLRFDDLMVAWEKCQLIFAQPLTPPTRFSVCLGVFYTSRKDRIFASLHKKLSGVSDENVANVIMAKLMQLENWMRSLTNKQ